MSRILLSITTSLDGYIATPTGGVRWLVAYADAFDGFDAFMRTVGAIAMGRRMFDYIVATASQGRSPYGKVPSFVMTHRPARAGLGCEFVSGSPSELAERFRNATDKDIWLMGGGIVARDFLDAGLVDAMTLTVIPVLLGDGIRLFPARSGDAEAWTLVGTKTNKSGALVVRYERAGSVAGARP